MIGELPKSLVVSGKEYPVRSDFRVALLIFQAYNDANLSGYEKMMVCVRCLFEEVPGDITSAIKMAIWFLDGGDVPKSSSNGPKLLDWEQDESLIFSAINKVAGTEVRAVKYMHWWTFLGLFNEIGEGVLFNVISLRVKKIKGKRLEKGEQEFYREHKEMIDLKPQYSDEEQIEIDRLKRLLE